MPDLGKAVKDRTRDLLSDIERRATDIHRDGFRDVLSDVRLSAKRIIDAGEACDPGMIDGLVDLAGELRDLRVIVTSHRGLTGEQLAIGDPQAVDAFEKDLHELLFNAQHAVKLGMGECVRLAVEEGDDPLVPLPFESPEQFRVRTTRPFPGQRS